MSAVSCSNVTRRFGDLTAVDGVSFEIINSDEYLQVVNDTDAELQVRSVADLFAVPGGVQARKSDGSTANAFTWRPWSWTAPPAASTRKSARAMLSASIRSSRTSAPSVSSSRHSGRRIGLSSHGYSLLTGLRTLHTVRAWRR